MVGIIVYFARSVGESITHANALAAFLYDKQRPTTWLFARKIIAYSFMLTPFWYVKYSAVLDRFIFHMFVFCGLPRVFSAAPPSFQILEFSLTLRTGLAEMLFIRNQIPSARQWRCNTFSILRYVRKFCLDQRHAI